MQLLRELYPEGVKMRSRRRFRRRVYRNKVGGTLGHTQWVCYYTFVQGPSYLWHTDGYDKLTPYGMTIHGCIDG